jgi:hypothetical protein
VRLRLSTCPPRPSAASASTASAFHALRYRGGGCMRIAPARLFDTSYEGTTERPANHSATSASVECERELVAQQDYRASSDGGVACLMHTAVATSVPRPETDASTDAMARPRSARWPGCARRSFSLTARNTSRESARASRAELDPMRTLDRAHVRERAFPDVSDVRSRSLPGTDCETMSRGPSSLAVEPHRAAWIVEAHHREAQPSALGVLRVAAGRSRLRRLGAAADARAARSSAPCRRDRRR